MEIRISEELVEWNPFPISLARVVSYRRDSTILTRSIAMGGNVIKVSGTRS
jgi:hypothetical protein